MDNKIKYYKINDIVLGLQGVIEKYNKFLKYYFEENQKLLKTDIGFQILNTFINLDKNNSEENVFSEILKCSTTPTKDMILEYNLDNFNDFVLNNPEAINIFETAELKQMSDLNETYKWISMNLIVNIDTYINMFFKLLLNYNNAESLPKGFNDNPKKFIYEKYSNLKNLCDKEIAYYLDLHSIRNNYVHNAMIIDDKLINKLNLNTDNNKELKMFLPVFDKVILYALACLEIVFIFSDNVFEEINLYDIFKTKPVIEWLEKYRKHKNEHK